MRYMGNMGPIGFVIFALLAVVAYFVPAWIAAHRKHPQAAAIFILNFLLGWTILGWIAALIWSATAVEKTPS